MSVSAGDATSASAGRRDAVVPPGPAGPAGPAPAAPPRIRPPDIGAWLPGWWARIGVLALGAGLAGTEVRGIWLVVAVVLAVVSAAAPASLFAWALLLYLGAASIASPPDGWTPTSALLVAGLHALHVIASFSLALPPSGRMSVRVLVAPARRFVAIQVPVQVLAVLVLTLLAPDGSSVHARPVALLGAVAVVAGGVLAAWRWRR